MNEAVAKRLEEAETAQTKAEIKKKQHTYHQTVTHVPSPRISKEKDSKRGTLQDKFMDTQKIPFKQSLQAK